MKLNRNSKQWKDVYNQALATIVATKGKTKTVSKMFCDKIEREVPNYVFKQREVKWWQQPEMEYVQDGYRKDVDFDMGMRYTVVDAMPDRIKEAEEYADAIIKAMR